MTTEIFPPTPDQPIEQRGEVSMPDDDIVFMTKYDEMPEDEFLALIKELRSQSPAAVDKLRSSLIARRDVLRGQKRSLSMMSAANISGMSSELRENNETRTKQAEEIDRKITHLAYLSAVLEQSLVS